jgi:hypothetical protein
MEQDGAGYQQSIICHPRRCHQNLKRAIRNVRFDNVFCDTQEDENCCPANTKLTASKYPAEDTHQQTGYDRYIKA